MVAASRVQIKMGLHTTDAIVLRRYPYRETSVIVTCLTQQHGKLKGLVKGLRVNSNRYGSAMEPSTINRIVFYDTNTSQLHLISQCDLLAPLSGLQRDLNTAREASLCLKLVDAVMPLEEPHYEVYQLLRHTLERLAQADCDTPSVRLHCVVRLLRLIGFQPQLDQCTGCNTPGQKHGYWSARQGGLLCHRCLHEDPEAEPADAKLIASLTALSGASEPIALDVSLSPILRQRIDEFLQWRLDRPLKTLTT